MTQAPPSYATPYRPPALPESARPNIHGRSLLGLHALDAVQGIASADANALLRATQQMQALKLAEFLACAANRNQGRLQLI